MILQKKIQCFITGHVWWPAVTHWALHDGKKVYHCTRCFKVDIRE